MLEDVGFDTTTTWEPAGLARVTQVSLFDGIVQKDRAPQMDAEMMPTNSVESTPGSSAMDIRHRIHKTERSRR